MTDPSDLDSIVTDGSTTPVVPGPHVLHAVIDTTTPTAPENVFMPTENPDGSWTTKVPADPPGGRSVAPMKRPQCRPGCGELLGSEDGEWYVVHVGSAPVPQMEVGKTVVFCSVYCADAGRPLNPATPPVFFGWLFDRALSPEEVAERVAKAPVGDEGKAT